MGLFDSFKSKKSKDSDMSEDMSYIADMRVFEGPWTQYDILLASKIYGWNYMVDSADYMIHAELEHIGTVSISKILGGDEKELIDEFHLNGDSLKKMDSLLEESSLLSIGGMSKIVGGPVKIIWFNQTRVLRIFTPVNDVDLMNRYAETMIRRTFQTSDAMKKAKQVDPSGNI